MKDLPGTWEATMRPTIGSLRAQMRFANDDGTLTGTATGRDKTVPMTAIRYSQVADGERGTWAQTITKPTRLELKFDVFEVGDVTTGHSRAGWLPRSEVSGTRIKGS